MLRITREPITTEEALEIGYRTTKWFDRLFRRQRQTNDQIRSALLDVYDVAVDECFVYDSGNDFLVYFFDVGGAILILFGQWLFDPHVVIAPSDTLENWDCEREFFAKFSMRCWADPKIVLKLSVDGDRTVPAQPLRNRLKFNRLHEWELIPGHGATLLQDLRNAGVADAPTA